MYQVKCDSCGKTYAVWVNWEQPPRSKEDEVEKLRNFLESAGWKVLTSSIGDLDIFSDWCEYCNMDFEAAEAVDSVSISMAKVRESIVIGKKHE